MHQFQAKFRFSVIEALEVFEREINPVPLQVFLDIPQNIGELKGNATGFSALLGSTVMKPENVNANESDRRGNVIAIAIEILKAPIAGSCQIHLRSINQLDKILGRDLKCPYSVVKRRQRGMLVAVSSNDLIEQFPTAYKFFLLIGGASFVIADVVALPHKGIDGRKSLTFPSR